MVCFPPYPPACVCLLLDRGRGIEAKGLKCRAESLSKPCQRLSEVHESSKLCGW